MDRQPRRFQTSAIAVVAMLCAALLGHVAALPALGQDTGRSARAQRYDVSLQVQQGGDVLVTETQEIAFRGGPFQKGHRRIPVSRLGGVGEVRVEEPGQAYRPGYEAPYTFAVNGATQGGSGEVLIEWWFPPTSNATRTFVISYRAREAVRFYPGGDQLRWQVLGPGLSYPVAQSTVTLRLPADVPDGGWQTDAYPRQFVDSGGTGARGATATWLARNIPANQPLEVRAQWPSGLVAGSPPAWQAAADAEDWQRENLRPVLTLAFGGLGLLIPVFGALGILVTWYTRGRDPRIGSVPPEVDAPPSDLPPALVGTVVDEHADVHDVVATVIDLAERGIIRITELRDPKLAGSHRDFEVELLEPEPPGLRPYERAVLNTFFARGNPVRLSQLGGWFHTAIPAIQQALHREAAAAGLFAEDPEAARQRYRRWGTLMLIGGAVLGLFACGAAPAYAGAIQWPFLGLALVGAMLRWVAVRMPQRTAAGALEAARWRAYARYLAKARPDALARSAAGGQPESRGLRRDGDHRGGDGRDPGDEAERRGEVFERALPYAVALGIDRTWVQKFATVGAPAPRWLQMPPVVVVGGPTWGGPWGIPGGYGGFPGGYGGFPGRHGGGAPPAPGSAPAGPEAAGSPGAPWPQGWSDNAAGGLEQASGSLADLLNTASEVLSRGGGSDWSGGGFGGGGFGGGGGGSGGGGGGFE